MNESKSLNFKILSSASFKGVNRSGNSATSLQTSSHSNSENESSTFKKPRRSGKHQTHACVSCKKRRKKCDGGYPMCSGCEKLNIECTIIYSPTGKEIKKNHLESMENKIEELENQISILESKKNLQEKSNDNFQSFEDVLRYPPTVQNNQSLAEEVGFITLEAASEPRYIGGTSAYSIAKVISKSLNCYSANVSNKSSDSGSPRPDKSKNTPFEFPSLKFARSLMDSYTNSVQCQYPFLHWKEIEQYYNEIIVKRKKNPLASFFIFMVLAIGSQLEQSNQLNTSLNFTQSYYEKAFENVEMVIEPANLKTVQAYLLMAVFSQKMPDGSSVWQSTGLAIRTAVALGLHRKPYRKKSDGPGIQELEDLKSRIFWSAYGLERINGLLLGRPFSISDIDIDTAFPIETEETRVACHVIKLRRIQSNICTFIYNPLHSRQADEVEATRVQILLELNEWMNTFPFKSNAVSTFETNNWSLISYHNCILLLLRPVILDIAKKKQDATKRDLQWFKVFTESASAVCINYKTMHLRDKLGYTWLAIHCCFVSGISFLYCIWLDKSLNVLEWKRKSLIYETINSCSSILYVLAERWSSASIFRNTFERLAYIIKYTLDDAEEPIDSIMADVLKTGVFIDGSIEIDSYLRGAKCEGKFTRRPSENCFSIPPFDSSNVELQGNDNNYSVWEFLNSTGDHYLRNLSSQMEQSISEL
ncbi:Stb5 protein [Martiniozyma asiatica (nom. inval.)]|nr:Stb5 protein [Martiniozyma asiatica]